MSVPLVKGGRPAFLLLLLFLLLLQLAHEANDLGDLGVVKVEEIVLTDESILDLAREFEPVLARPRAQIAERADGFLSRPLRRMDGLEQHVIGVRPALVGATRLAVAHVQL